ncbi:MAG: right-handed parallel beta-helix repeat-containing protein [Candidatus Methanoperedens sp.]|nr:right-handed parallel beta-helix repeat-containing protein [Candidatus Methanoperedens sp.]MCZ7369670.1 right-handed parallel beta-helix repeat-containing protein [Candidatus Methanoperedens sp.]
MNKKFGLIAFVTIGTILFFVASATITSASTIYVPDNHITIQEAVNASNGGDMIIVRDGTYSENIKVNKRLTIRSENGSAFSKIIAANPKNNVFTVTADYVNIKGLTITGTTSNKLTEFAAGIYLELGVDYCNISDNNVSNNGDGIWLWNSGNNIIANNIANSNENIGIFVVSISDNNTIINNIVNFNNVSGIELWGSNNNMIVNNTASGNDRGVYLWDSSENSLSGNNADSNKNNGFYLLLGGDNLLQNNAISKTHNGIYLDKSRNNRLQNTTLSSNNYGIYMFSSDSIIDSNNFIDNKENIYNVTYPLPLFEIVFSFAGLLAMLYVAFRYRRHFSRFGDLSRKSITGFQVFIIIINILLYLELISQNFMPIMNVFNLTILIILAFIGLLIFVLGVFIIFWSIYLLIKEVFIHGNKLIERGPYKFVRHPLYLGWIIGTLGLALSANSLIGLIYSLILALILSYIAEYEEEDSRTRIGDEYGEYMKKVPRLFPFGR